jgi:hypothetical protein
MVVRALLLSLACSLPTAAQTDLLPAGVDPADDFGAAVAAAGVYLAVGAPGDDDAGTDAGAVYLLTADPRAEQVAKLVPSAPGTTGFGDTLAMAEDVLAVRALVGSVETVFVFHRSKVSWIQTAVLPAPGVDVLVTDGKRLVLGDSDGYFSDLLIYVFQGGAWVLEQALPSVDQLTQHASIEGDRVLVVRQVFLSFPVVESYRRTGSGWVFEESFAEGFHSGGAPDTWSYRPTRVLLQGTRAYVSWSITHCLTWPPGCDDAFYQALVWDHDGSQWTGGAVVPQLDYMLQSDIVLVEDALAGVSVDAQGETLVLVEEVAGSWTVTDTIAIPEDVVPGAATPDAIVTVPTAGPSAGAATLYGFDPWYNAGHGMVGSGGLVPRVLGIGVAYPTTTNTITLVDALPGSVTHLVVGLSRLATPIKAGVLVPFPDLVIFGLPVDATGSYSFSTVWPVGPIGIPYWFQHWVQDPAGPKGLVCSDALLSVW